KEDGMITTRKKFEFIPPENALRIGDRKEPFQKENGQEYERMLSNCSGVEALDLLAEINAGFNHNGLPGGLLELRNEICKPNVTINWPDTSGSELLAEIEQRRFDPSNEPEATKAVYTLSG